MKNVIGERIIHEEDRIQVDGWIINMRLWELDVE